MYAKNPLGCHPTVTKEMAKQWLDFPRQQALKFTRRETKLYAPFRGKGTFNVILPFQRPVDAKRSEASSLILLPLPDISSSSKQWRGRSFLPPQHEVFVIQCPIPLDRWGPANISTRVSHDLRHLLLEAPRALIKLADYQGNYFATPDNFEMTVEESQR